tara:strand:- start:6692 stop:10003 length:3312 start_codon:yes stop_codon:yes gene_type:complete
MAEQEKTYNAEFADLLLKLNKIMVSRGEHFRARAYKKAHETIIGITEPITHIDMIKGKQGIGSTIFAKLQEFVDTGKIELIEKEKSNPVNILTGVYGIGPKKANELVKTHKITTIDQLRDNKHLLNDKQMIGLEYYEDILERIPRDEIKVFEKVFEETLKSLPDYSTSTTFEIVGSYRRGAKDSGDIDVIITDMNDKKMVFKQFIDALIERNIIIEILSKGNVKCLAIGVKDGGGTPRRIDFLYATPEEYPFSILYFTGSATFNTVMRQHALNLGYSLNEHGIYKMKGTKKGDKINIKSGFNNEKDIFNFLWMEYKEPNERIDSRSLVLKKKKTIKVKKSKVKQLESRIKEIRESAKKPVEEDTQVVKPSKTKFKIKIRKPTKKMETTESKKTETEIEKDIDTKPNITKKMKTIKTTKLKKRITLKPKTQDVDKTKDVDKIQEIVMSSADKFKKNGISYLKTLKKRELENLYEEANSAYYNDKPIFNDNLFDILKEYIEERYPKASVLEQTGADIDVEKEKVKLPYFMGSMDKIKPDTNALNKFKNKYRGTYTLSCKLDGVSALYLSSGKLYTRGNGTYGQDISYLIPYLELPELDETDIAIRGEIIMKKKVFEKKYKMKTSNARNLVAGIINSKRSTADKYNDLDFVAYEVIKPEMETSKQFEMMEDSSMKPLIVVKNIQMDEIDLTNEVLSDILLDWRENYEYEIDGVIVSHNDLYKRKDGNPSHSLAFKMVLTDQIVEAKVLDVLWCPSKDGYLKPRIQIEPVVIGGARIEYATAFNAAYVKDNGIGIGALITLVRSGDVIPHIMNVTQPADEIKMPDEKYKWNSTNVDIILIDKDSNAKVREKNIISFFVGIGTKGLGPGVVRQLIKAGYDTIYKILNIDIQDLEKIEGFQKKKASNIYKAVQDSISEANILEILSASNILGRGFGKERIGTIFKHYPDILIDNGLTDEEKIANISVISGFAIKTATNFVKNIDNVNEFLLNNDLMYKYDSFLKEGLENKKQSKKTSTTKTGTLTTISNDDDIEEDIMNGVTVVLTGFRDKELEKQVKSLGGKIGSSVTKNTTYVIVNDMDTDTGKADKAKKIGVPLIMVEDFKKKYDI